MSKEQILWQGKWYDLVVTIFGDPAMGWYEYRIQNDNGDVLQESDVQYGMTAVAASDAFRWIAENTCIGAITE